MSRPLLAQKPMVDHKKGARRRSAADFHAEVFKAWGNRCYFGGDHYATDAAHLTPRSQLGPKRRYACAVANGRPLCRTHHDEQEIGKIDFGLADRLAAVRALNLFDPKLPRIKEPIA